MPPRPSTAAVGGAASNIRDSTSICSWAGVGSSELAKPTPRMCGTAAAAGVRPPPQAAGHMHSSRGHIVADAVSCGRSSGDSSCAISGDDVADGRRHAAAAACSASPPPSLPPPASPSCRPAVAQLPPFRGSSPRRPSPAAMTARSSTLSPAPRHPPAAALPLSLRAASTSVGAAGWWPGSLGGGVRSGSPRCPAGDADVSASLRKIRVRSTSAAPQGAPLGQQQQPSLCSPLKPPPLCSSGGSGVAAAVLQRVTSIGRWLSGIPECRVCLLTEAEAAAGGAAGGADGDSETDGEIEAGPEPLISAPCK
jgi:hypothetical protein